MIKEYLEVGQIVGTHGVRGEMRINPWTDTPGFLTGFKTLYCDDKGEKTISVVSLRSHGNVVLFKAENVDTVEAAALMKNQILYIKRSDANLNNRQYFIAELIGCTVINENTSEEYGIISDVFKTGANDVWEIKKGEQAFLMPAIKDVVKSVDVVAGIIKIIPMRGIFNDED